MVRVPKVDTTRRIFIYVTDAISIFFGLSLGVVKLFSIALIDNSYLWPAIGSSACLLGVYACFWRVQRDAFRGRPRPIPLIAVGGALATGSLLIAPMGGEFGPLVWLMGVALHFSIRATLGFMVLVVAGSNVYFPIRFEELGTWPLILFDVYQMASWSIVLAGLMIAFAWLWDAAREFHAGQEARAKLAVSEERLRFARDLHDLLGHSLALINLKSELAARLGEKDPARASAEMREVAGMARDSLKEMRAAVRGYRTVDLDDELARVRSVLDDAGVRCTVDAELAGLPAEQRELLAWAVREGATNILKHTAASYCAITIRDGVLEIRNDGLGTGEGPGDGSGLHGLSERMRTAGGTFSAAATGEGEFLLRAAVPA